MKNNLVQFPVDRIVRRMAPDPKRGWHRFKQNLQTVMFIIISVAAMVVGLVIAFNGLFA